MSHSTSRLGSCSRWKHRGTACEGPPHMREGGAVCSLACHAASQEGTRGCHASTGASRCAPGTRAGLQARARSTSHHGASVPRRHHGPSIGINAKAGQRADRWQQRHAARSARSVRRGRAEAVPMMPRHEGTPSGQPCAVAAHLRSKVWAQHTPQPQHWRCGSVPIGDFLPPFLSRVCGVCLSMPAAMATRALVCHRHDYCLRYTYDSDDSRARRRAWRTLALDKRHGSRPGEGRVCWRRVCGCCPWPRPPRLRPRPGHPRRAREYRGYEACAVWQACWGAQASGGALRQCAPPPSRGTGVPSRLPPCAAVSW